MNNSVSYLPLAQPLSGLNQYSVINDRDLLFKIYDSCYFNGDLRASWVGPGIPKTDCVHTMPSVPLLPITYWSTWALEHWVMYYGFLLDIDDKSKEVDILDIGCGTGFNTINLTKVFSNAHIVAMDLDTRVIEFASNYNNDPSITYMVRDATLFEHTTKYDFIFCMELLEHVKAEYHYGMIDKCLWLLKPGGKLFITTPNFPDSKDATTPHGHIGMLNRERSIQFFNRYDRNIESVEYFDNSTLKTCIPDKFIIKGDKDDFDKNDGMNRSHYKITMSNPGEYVCLTV